MIRPAPKSQRKSLYMIRRPEQIEALASPARQEILDAVQAIGPCSIADAAALLGRPADALYYHFRPLVKVGLLVGRGERGTGRNVEALYDVPGQRMQIAYEAVQHEGVAAAVASMLRLTNRDFAAALRIGEGVLQGPRRDTWAGRVKGWLTDDELAQANRHLRALLRIVAKGRRPQGARLHAFMFALMPLPGANSRRGGADSNQGADK